VLTVDRLLDLGQRALLRTARSVGEAPVKQPYLVGKAVHAVTTVVQGVAAGVALLAVAVTCSLVWHLATVSPTSSGDEVRAVLAARPYHAALGVITLLVARRVMFRLRDKTN
jgi:hypothetical protein